LSLYHGVPRRLAPGRADPTVKIIPAPARRTTARSDASVTTAAASITGALPSSHPHIMRPAHSPNILICESRGLWDTIAAMTVQQNRKRLGQLHLMPHRDEYGLRTILGPQDCSYHLPISSIERRLGPPSRGRLLILASEARLGTAYGRDIKEQTHMTGNPKAAWMRYALAIKDNDIWRNIELSKDLQQGWGFTEGQQAGNVGEVGGTHYALTLDDGQGRIVQHDDASVDSGCRGGNRNIRTSDVAHITHIRAHLDMAP